VTALAAENDQLRSNAQGLALQLCEAKTVARSQLGDATLKCRQTEEAAALRTASMEEQSERQRRVLVRAGQVYIYAHLPPPPAALRPLHRVAAGAGTWHGCSARGASSHRVAIARASIVSVLVNLS
jgi:hypothetical protein